MNRARSFFYVSLGVLALAVAYHFGASSARASVGGQVVGFTIDSFALGIWVMTAEGDVYHRPHATYWHQTSTSFVGNIWDSGPTPAQQESFGQLKARYRGERAAVPQGATQPQRVDKR